jgi:hypothetical protein
MTALRTFRQADIRRAIVAIKSAGLSISSVCIATTGDIQVMTEPPQTVPPDRFEKWKTEAYGDVAAQGA